AAFQGTADNEGVVEFQWRLALPAAARPPATAWPALAYPEPSEGSLTRPGYRAIAYPRPKTPSGDDHIMPIALASDPRSGRLFVAATRFGEIYALEDPTGDGRQAQFVGYAHGLFQEVYSMLAEPNALYVLHRRNLTRITDSDGDGKADRFDCVYGIPQGITDAYDYGYGLVRDTSGAFVFSLAPHANRHLPGSGGAIRLPAD